jgi:dienelactone hydrolase
MGSTTAISSRQAGSMFVLLLSCACQTGLAATAGILPQPAPDPAADEVVDADGAQGQQALIDAPFGNRRAPLVELPAPTGPHAVGTAELVAVDDSRPTATGVGRTLLLRLWYPAVESDAPAAPYFLDPARAERSGRAAYMPLPADLLAGTQGVAQERVVPAAAEPRAAVLLSPGWRAPVELYSALATELASLGYLVLGVQHPGGPGALSAEDGAPSPEPWELVPDRRTSGAWAGDLEYLAGWLDDADQVADASLDPDARDNVREAVLQLDGAHIAALGHCFGGSAALAADAASERIAASIALESAVIGEPAEIGASARSLWLSSPERAALDPGLDEFLEAAGERSQAFDVEGTLYADYADTRWLFSELLARAPDLGAEGYGLGPIGADRAHAVISAQVRAFLAAAFGGSASSQLDAELFPELTPHAAPAD